MAKFKALVRYQRKDEFYPVYIRVAHKDKSGFIKTDKVVDAKGIGKDKGIRDPFVLKYCSDKISYYIELLNKINYENWNVNDIIEYVQKSNADICFSDYARKFHDEMYNNGQPRNARNYELAYQHLERFAGTNKVMFSQLTSTFMNAWVKSLNSTARAKEMYPVCIRQIFKQALVDYNDYDNGIIRITTNPWPKVKIPKCDTPEKKAITMEECRAFFFVSLPESDRKLSLSELGRDVAMMILCLAGMNTADIFELRKDGYKDGVISYERLKTRKLRRDNAYIEMRVPNILQPVFEKYLDKTDSPYLFNFYKRYNSFDSFCANVNAGIRTICLDVLELPKGKTYSCYTFRHTWATVAQNECDASISEVGFAMNHSDRSRVTRTYVKVDFTPAWKLNEKVVEKIFFTEDLSRHHNHEENKKEFERFSFKQLIRGTVFFRGKAIKTIEDIGFNNVEEIIAKLMNQLPDTIPSRTMVQIRVENIDKRQKQDYTRMVK